MIESGMNCESEQWLEQLQSHLNYLETTQSHEIIGNENFWEKISVLSEKIVEHVKLTKSLSSYNLVLQWIECFKAIIIVEDKDMTNKLTDGAIKIVFRNLLKTDTVYPPWLLTQFFNFSFEYISFQSCILDNLYTAVCRAKEFHIQKSFIEIISRNFEINLVHDTIVKKNISKEMKLLFIKLLEDDNEEIIRLFLNKLNNESLTLRIFSFYSSEIKFNGFPLIKNTWADINIFANTLTFCCKKSNLIMDDIIQDSPVNENDIISIKIKYIYYLRYKRYKSDFNEKHELILELTKPCTGYYDSTSEFLQNYKMITIFVIENLDHFNNFIRNFFAPNLEIVDPYNFEVNLHEKLEASSSTVPRLSSLENIEDNKIDDPSKFPNGNECCSAPAEQVSSSESRIELQTPCDCPNICVEDSPKTDNCIHQDSDIPEYEHLNYDSQALIPQQRSTNITEDEDSSSQENSPPIEVYAENTQENMECDCVPRSGLPASVHSTPHITVLTPEDINQCSPDVIDPSQKTQICDNICPAEPQTEKVCTEIIQEQNLTPAVVPAVDEPESEDDVPLAIRAQQNVQKEDDQRSQVSSIVSNKIQRSQNKLNFSQNSRTSTASSRARKRRLSEVDPLYHPGDELSNTYKLNETAKRRKRRDSYLPEDDEVDDEKSEFDDSSFFSDKEKDKESDPEFIYTRTRRIKKPDIYQSDTEPTRRRPKQRKNVPPGMNTHPSNIIKTILPFAIRTPVIPTASNNLNNNKYATCIQPEEIPNCSADLKQQNTTDVVTNNVVQIQSETEAGPIKDRRNTIDAVPPKKIEKVRRITNINNLDHLEEQPQGEVFRIAIPTLKNQTNKIPEDVKSVQNCRQEANNKENEIIATRHKNMDIFDKLQQNVPLTQNSITNRKIAFFSSSSSSSSQNSTRRVLPEKHSLDVADHEESFSSPEEIPQVVPTANKIIPQARTSAPKENNPLVVPGPSNKIVSPGVAGPSRSTKNGEKIAVAAKRKPRKPKESKVTGTDVTKKTKGCPKKSKGCEPGSPALKSKGGKKNIEKNDANTTAAVIENMLPNLDQILPAIQGTSTCSKCGASDSKVELSKEILKAIKVLCKLCLMSCTDDKRADYCAKMEKIFRDIKKQK